MYDISMKINDSIQGNRARKTVSFKLEIVEELNKLRGGKTFSTFLNDFLWEKLKIMKGGKDE